MFFLSFVPPFLSFFPKLSKESLEELQDPENHDESQRQSRPFKEIRSGNEKSLGRWQVKTTCLLHEKSIIQLFLSTLTKQGNDFLVYQSTLDTVHT